LYVLIFQLFFDSLLQSGTIYINIFNFHGTEVVICIKLVLFKRAWIVHKAIVSKRKTIVNFEPRFNYQLSKYHLSSTVLESWSDRMLCNKVLISSEKLWNFDLKKSPCLNSFALGGWVVKNLNKNWSHQTAKTRTICNNRCFN